MVKKLLGKAGRHAVAHHAGSGGLFDIRYGFALLKDRQVPAGSKFLALALGVALTGALLAFEAPLELILGVFVPLLGVAADTVVDGLEIVALPLVFACMFLPRIVAKRQAQAVRNLR